jgi:hypothetical protein
MTLWVETTASSHDEVSKEVVGLLAHVLVFKEDIFDELSSIASIDLADIEQPDNFKARTFWAAVVLQLRRQAKLKDLIEHMAQRFPARRADFERFLTLDTATATVSSFSAAAVEAASWQAFDDPLEARFVGPGRAAPIFDRENLRSDLMRLRRQGYRTLNITGTPRSGKSFSLQLVQLVCETDQAPIVAVDVEDWGSDEFTDIDLVQALAVQLKVDVDCSAVANVPDPHTRARLLLYALRDTIEAPPANPRWIVIDGLDRPSVHPTAKAFVERLLKSIEKDNKPANTRLVVTGFDGILPSSSRQDRTADITVDDVDALLKVVVANRQPAVTDEERATWVSEAMTAYEQSGRDLGVLGSEIFRRVSEHLGDGGP